MSSEAQEKWAMNANIAMAVVLPLGELAAIGVTSWVVVGAALDAGGATRIGILFGYCLLLLVLLIAFATLVLQVWVNPGRVRKSEEATPLGDVYLCNHTGDERFCSDCGMTKPNRTSHCHILGFCIDRYDHYCPYASGAVSATTHKNFFLFVLYASFYTLFSSITIAVFLKERIDRSDSKPASWIAALTVSSLFFFFSAGMVAESMKNLLANMTSVENLKKGATQYIAVRGRAANALQTPILNPRLRQITSVIGETERDGQFYIIFMLNPGFGPLWRRGPMENFKSVMGESFLDWANPFSRSPIVKAGKDELRYTWGFSVEALMLEYGCGTFSRNRPKHLSIVSGEKSSVFRVRG
ncbi:hypothetical protein P154DRAFT_525916 [Amniculicola lignicola CBS 123094]|uniref:Palmitoyltransferase n=1 Tax=Amniculicola lignicola CBS 123094 TaxID=1392246 RepID=A0A6A5W4G3_9PLEO|nr:hypothetical protein P154DRAFT_525916 [Amniculicola lignicola CBS 123094]